jgi:hypothetical protein
VRDDDVRSSCFAALDVLQAQYGPELPWPALAAGFAFRGRRFHGRPIVIPSRRACQPDPERLAARFERFLGRG